jgi:hypothetical protein
VSLKKVSLPFKFVWFGEKVWRSGLKIYWSGLEIDGFGLKSIFWNEKSMVHA